MQEPLSEGGLENLPRHVAGRFQMKCPASAPVRPIWQLEEGRISSGSWCLDTQDLQVLQRLSKEARRRGLVEVHRGGRRIHRRDRRLREHNRLLNEHNRWPKSEFGQQLPVAAANGHSSIPPGSGQVHITGEACLVRSPHLLRAPLRTRPMQAPAYGEFGSTPRCLRAAVLCNLTELLHCRRLRLVPGCMARPRVARQTSKTTNVRCCINVLGLACGACRSGPAWISARIQD